MARHAVVLPPGKCGHPVSYTHLDVYKRQEVIMDKKYIENQYHLAVLDFQTARSEEAQWEARKTMARLEQIAAQEYGFEYADDLHERELGGKRV